MSATLRFLDLAYLCLPSFIHPTLHHDEETKPRRPRWVDETSARAAGCLHPRTSQIPLARTCAVGRVPRRRQARWGVRLGDDQQPFGTGYF